MVAAMKPHQHHETLRELRRNVYAAAILLATIMLGAGIIHMVWP